MLQIFVMFVSPCSRAVMICARTLGLNIDVIHVDIEPDREKEFLAVSPNRIIPVINDDGFILMNVHAILPYLVTKYANGNPLYPSDIFQKALIDQRLHFNSGVLLASHSRLCITRSGPAIGKAWEESRLGAAIDQLELFLLSSAFVAGDNVTIADICIWTTLANVMSYRVMNPIMYPNITKWLGKMNAIPFAENNSLR
nr:glutathione S-transferase D7-like isoform X2 [Leptinotarsa decemlineata]